MPELSFVLPRVIAHRGASAAAPENTLAAFRRAREEGATWIECDVKLTADGRPVIFHDDTLDRTTDGSGPMVDAPLDVVGALDAGGWFSPDFRGEPVPTLEETLDLLADLGMGANLEIKPCPGRERETAAVTAAAVQPYLDRVPVLLSSFADDSLAAAREAAPDVPRGLLVEAVPADWQARAAALECVALHVDAVPLTAEQVAAMRAAGYKVVVWTVNGESEARRLVEWGVDAVITDAPQRIGAAIG